MMTDLFSALDCNQISLGILIWGFPVLAALLILNDSWTNSTIMSLSKIVSGVHSDSRNDMYGSSHFLFALMFTILVFNSGGLAPFAYGLTSNLLMISSMALVMWGSLLISGYIFSPMNSLAHLAPSGAPMALTPLLVLIETVSILIRPLTLTVRLVANISAGHIVLALVASCLTGMTGVAFSLMFTVNIFYHMFEVFVCIVQSYIFSLLVKLYSEEHP